MVAIAASHCRQTNHLLSTMHECMHAMAAYSSLQLTHCISANYNPGGRPPRPRPLHEFPPLDHVVETCKPAPPEGIPRPGPPHRNIYIWAEACAPYSHIFLDLSIIHTSTIRTYPPRVETGLVHIQVVLGCGEID